MRWLVEFYNERQGILARYGIEASLPASAALLGRNALLAEHPPARARRRLSLFERAERVGGQDGSGWVLHRIVKDSGPDQLTSHQRQRHRNEGHGIGAAVSYSSGLVRLLVRW